MNHGDYKRSIFTNTAIATSFILLLLAGGCRDDSLEALMPPECDTAEVSLEQDITPILTSNCTSCHGSFQQTAGYNFEDFEDLREAAMNGDLSGAINHDEGYEPMPPDPGSLSNCEIEKIDAWIQQGARNN